MNIYIYDAALDMIEVAIHIYIHKCTCIYREEERDRYVIRSIFLGLCTYSHVYTYIYVYIYIYYPCTYTYKFIQIYVYVHIHTYIYI